jgi:hypothetical protein
MSESGLRYPEGSEFGLAYIPTRPAPKCEPCGQPKVYADGGYYCVTEGCPVDT